MNPRSEEVIGPVIGITTVLRAGCSTESLAVASSSAALPGNCGDAITKAIANGRSKNRETGEKRHRSDLAFMKKTVALRLAKNRMVPFGPQVAK
jgi:hypothetical protein